MGAVIDALDDELPSAPRLALAGREQLQTSTTRGSNEQSYTFA
jgi:hypothetical protein